jgi:protein NrfD
MRDLVLTRHNELIDPLVRVWGWEIPVYLFLGGWVAGMMIIVGSFLLRGRHREETCVCSVLPGLSVVILSFGMVALFLDLEHKLYVWRLYTTFQVTSPMSWGAWILLLVYPALTAAFILRPPELIRGVWTGFDRLTALFGEPRFARLIATATIVLGVSLGIYTGILLSSLGARPFWSSAILGPLFLVSGLSSAAAFAHLVARHVEERELLAKSDNVFLLIELFVMVVGVGVVIPLIIQVLAVSHRIQHTPIGPLLVMAGGLALRFVVVAAGQVSHWGKG